MYLYSKNGSRASSTIDNKQKNIDLQDGSMKVAAQEEDLQFLAQILQEQLRAEVPSGDFFQIKCAVKNDQLMILAQHPVGVAVNIDTVFAVLEEALHSLPHHREQQADIFLRVAGQKLPYAKHSIALNLEPELESFEAERVEEQEYIRIHEDIYQPPDSYGQIWKPTPSENEPEDVPYDPLADAPDLSTYSPRRPAHRVKIILLGASVAVIAALSSAAYVFTRPCVLGECQEIQTAKQLQRSLGQKLSVRAEKELPKLQQQLETASASLKAIPFWSPHHQQAEQLSVSLSAQSEKINQVVKALEVGNLAMQKSRTPAVNQKELEARQQLWRQAVVQLETISSNNELYQLVQPQLLIYRTQLQATKQQMLAEEKWMKKLVAAKTVAVAAVKREASAKSLQDLLRVQSTWQIAVNALTAIPPNSSVYSEAQKLLIEYKPFLATARVQATKEMLAVKTYNQAITSANTAKRYEQQKQWSAAVTHWTLAVNAIKQVATDSMYYNQAQNLVEPYSTALKHAQKQLQAVSLSQRIRIDMNKVCFSTIRLCNYTIDNQGITVQLTPEYEQMLQGSVTPVNDQGNSDTAPTTPNHLQSLQQALEVVSDNGNLPLILYDVNGNAIHVHNPAS